MSEAPPQALELETDDTGELISVIKEETETEDARSFRTNRKMPGGTVDAGTRKLLLLLLAFVLAVSSASATEYIVSSAAQISQVMATAQPGDTLRMTDGSWTNQAILFQGNGTEARPIVLRGRAFGAVTLGGTSRLQIAGTNLIAENLVFVNGDCSPDPVVEFRNGSLESSHCRLTNSSISNYSPADINTDNKWISMYGWYNRVDHCSLRGKTNSGTTLVVWLTSHPNYHQIDHNYFGPRPVLGFNGGETIRVGTSDWSMYDSFTTVEYNLFDQCNGEIEVISSKSCGNVYRSNTFRGCQGTLTLRHGNRCTVEGNFFLAGNATNSGGIRIIGEDHLVINNYIASTGGTSYKAGLTMMDGIPDSPLNGYFQVKRARVLFNTFVNDRLTFNIGAGHDSSLTLPPLDCVIANNLMYGTSSPFFTMTDTPINMTYEGNIYFGATLGLTSAGFTHVDPQLSAVGSDGLQRLQGTSPAIDASAGAYPMVTLDMDGQLRDSLRDIGADEYSLSPIIRRPLTVADVGPGTGTSSVEGETAHQPSLCPTLYANYPNPFNPATVVTFQVPAGGRTVVRVHDILGREVACLFSGDALAHQLYRVQFDGKGRASGTYYVTLEFGGSRIVRPMMMVK
jgi:poly(beta-D-mannuronate) lyase